MRKRDILLAASLCLSFVGAGARAAAAQAGGEAPTAVARATEIRLTAEQVIVNRRIAQRALSRVDDLLERVDRAPPASIAAIAPRRELSAQQILASQRVAQEALTRVTMLQERLAGANPTPTPIVSRGRVTVTLGQLVTDQRIAQAAVRRVAAIERRVPALPESVDQPDWIVGRIQPSVNVVVVRQVRLGSATVGARIPVVLPASLSSLQFHAGTIANVKGVLFGGVLFGRTFSIEP